MGGRPLQRRELAAISAFVLAATLAIIIAWIGFGGDIPFAAQGYRLHIAFPNAPTLVAGADVRIAGVPVGRVVSVHAGEATTDATIELNSRFAPLRADALAMIRNKTLLGESYVELTQGTPGTRALPDGARLPAAQVVPTQQIEDVLNSFDAPTRRAFAQLVGDTSATLAGNGQQLNDALGASAPAAQSFRVLLSALNAQQSDVSTLVSRTAVALRAISAQPARLRDLVGAAGAVTATTAARARALTATVRAFAPFVSHLTATAPALAVTARLATPTLRTLVPVAPLVLPALRSTETLAPSLRATLIALRPAVHHARADLPAADALLRTLPGAGSALDAAGRQLVPLVQLVAAYDRDAVDSLASFGSVLEPIKGTSGSSYSRYARTAVLFTSEGNLGYAKREPSNRYNPYPPPGTLGDGKSLSCANASNPQTVPEPGSQVPCVVEPPWSFRGATRSFPLLTPYAPGPLPGAHRR